jgi:hypothetical protein
MRDANAAGEWLNQQPRGTARDQGVIAFVGEIALSHPDIAMAWAKTIGDPQQKEQWVNNVSRIQQDGSLRSKK